MVQNTFPCGLCEVDANWSEGGIACESCDVWYHRSCADLNMSSFNRLASSSQIWICAKCHSSNFSHYPFHYSLLYLTVSNSFDPISALDSDYPIFSPDPSSPAFQPKVYSTPTSTFSGSQALNTFSTPSFGPPTFSSIVTPDLDPSSIATPTENSSDGSTVPYSESTVPRKDNNWRTLVINANSIANKKAELAAIAEYCDPDLMLISETKLGPDILNGEFVPEGYMGRFRKDRKRGAGGVMIITKECYKIVDADITVQNENESVWAIITLKDLSKLVIGSFYRPPDKGIQPLVDLEMELAQISEKFKNNPKTTLILGGDFNTGGINWDLCTVDHDTSNRTLKEKLLSILSEAGLKQMQREPTGGQNLLDLFCCNKPSLVKSITSIPGISDHNIVLADCKLKPSIITKPQRKIYQWSKADWHSLREQTVVFAEDFLASATTRSVNENYIKFRTYLEEVMENKIPSKLSSKRFKLPWFNRELKRLCRKKARKYKKAKRSGREDHWEQYKEFQKVVQAKLTEGRWDYINRFLQIGLETGNKKHFWKYLRVQKQEDFGISALKSNGKMFTDRKSISEILNTQFKSVFTKKTSSKIPELPGVTFPSIKDLKITEFGVFKLLDKIDVSKASGPDCIPGRILQNLARELAPVLHFIFEQSLNTGDLPAEWTLANVAPIFKKGSKLQAVNYRPVSLTCISCKLFEHIVCKHILGHLEDHEILTDLQHGFRSGRSCETQLITTFHDIASAYNKKGSQIDIAVLDFSKAFDTVPHDGLLSKLKHYGIDDKIWLWISNFLKQRVVVDGIQSDLVTVDSGVPQGTVLGPILFLLHINDLPSVISSKVRLFADDCLVYREIKNRQDQIALQKDLNLLENWGSKWGMRFNAAKCNIMRMSRKQTPISTQYELSGQVLEEVKDAKYLGVTVSDDLEWTKHINAITTKANSKLSFLRRNLKGCPEKLRETAYFALVRSFLEYSATVWHPHQKYNSDKLEMVQRRAARFVKGRYGMYESVTQMLEELTWVPLSKRRENACLILFYKIINNLAMVP